MNPSGLMGLPRGQGRKFRRVVWDYGLFHQEVAAGVDAGNISAGWQTRVLNTVAVDTSDIYKLATNRVKLQPGKYRCNAYIPAMLNNESKPRIRNVTDGVTLGVGICQVTNRGGSHNAGIQMYLACVFEVYKITEIELQHYSSAGAGDGWNLGYNSTDSAERTVYAELELIRVRA